MIVVATDTEYELAKERFENQKIIKTGIGALNIAKTLKNYPKHIKITNFGYAGSNNIPKDTEVKVGTCKLYHPNVEYAEPEYNLNGDTPCYTSVDFVTSTKIKEPAVFDMELAFILGLGFTNVESIKIISDNLSLEEYKEKTNGTN